MSTISALVAFSSSTIAFAKDHSFLAPDGISLKAANNGAEEAEGDKEAEDVCMNEISNALSSKFLFGGVVFFRTWCSNKAGLFRVLPEKKNDWIKAQSNLVDELSNKKSRLAFKQHELDKQRELDNKHGVRKHVAKIYRTNSEWTDSKWVLQEMVAAVGPFMSKCQGRYAPYARLLKEWTDAQKSRGTGKWAENNL